MPAHRVLVVDDNLQVRRLITASLKTLSPEMEIVEAPSAEEALFISASHPLDLVVLDFRLPGMSGLEMVARLRKRKPGLNIILVTGVDDAATRAQVAEAGVAAYFFKPIEMSSFLQEVRRLLPSEPAVEPARNITPVKSEKTIHDNLPGTREPVPVSDHDPLPSLDACLSGLKKDLRATSVLLVNDVGQIVEMAGNPSQVTSGSTLLPALMEAFHASQRVSGAMGAGQVESYHAFANSRQSIILAPINAFNALLVVTPAVPASVNPGMVEMEIRQAVSELKAILEQARKAGSARRVTQPAQVEPTADVIVDPETMEQVDSMFAKAPKKAGKEQAEEFWESMGENGMAERKSGRDVLSYDEARDLGLAPDESKPV